MCGVRCARCVVVTPCGGTQKKTTCVGVCVACRCAHYSYVKCLWPSNSRTDLYSEMFVWAQLPSGALLEYSRNKTIGKFYQHSTLLIQPCLLINFVRFRSIFLRFISTRRNIL